MQDNENNTQHNGPMIGLSESYIESIRSMLTEERGPDLPKWPVLSHLIGSLRPFEYTILCGATGVGKTTFLANLSRQLLDQGVMHYVASVETGHADFSRRLASIYYGKDINTGEKFSDQELENIIKKTSGFFEKKQKQSESIYLAIYDNRIQVKKLISDLKLASARGCKVALLDNLNFFLEISSAQNALIEMDRVTHELVMLAKQLPMHIMMVMHPKKTDGGRVESEFDIKGSSTAVQEAHNVLLLNRLDPQLLANKEFRANIEKDGLSASAYRELKIAKLRKRGANVHRTVTFICHASTEYTESNIKPEAFASKTNTRFGMANRN